MSKIHIIHENDEWTAPLIQHLKELNLPYESWHLSKGSLDLTQEPPKGIFYNRMSASSHTRSHRFSPEYTGVVLDWLQAYGRKVFNDRNALRLEISKVAQYTALEVEGIKVPHTIAAMGNEEIIKASKSFEGRSFIIKHNRAGKGLGVRLFKNSEALRVAIESNELEPSVDGIYLLQEYIESPTSTITRCEFIGGKFVYAVEVSTLDGFELCPADACNIDDVFCPTTEQKQSKFTIIENFNHPIIEKYERFLSKNGISIAGIEFIKNSEGEIFTYDVNTNTNYNSTAEEAAGIYGMKEIAVFLGKQLKELYSLR
ncbi:ATP-grasp domain-containing protein [Niallia sp. 01092]|uniref:ATP-grasp domain-containing protein n=1 Tax=unclassified Niallia TaxID=2837522 RepID=UPI003FD3C851